MAKFGTDRVAMTLEMKISYFAPTNPGLVIAEGWLESGSSTLFAEGRLLDTDGKVLAKGSSTIRMIDMKRVAGMTGG
jgi:acyl-coenzyme A thioesterase PaaI-like protein